MSRLKTTREGIAKLRTNSGLGFGVLLDDLDAAHELEAELAGLRDEIGEAVGDYCTCPRRRTQCPCCRVRDLLASAKGESE